MPRCARSLTFLSMASLQSTRGSPKIQEGFGNAHESDLVLPKSENRAIMRGRVQQKDV